MTKIEELTKTREEADARMMKARAEWHIAETFVDLSEDDNELVKTKAEAYDARNKYDQVRAEYVDASEAEEAERWELYYLEELAAGRVQTRTELVTVTDGEFPF
jgi:hypothetical protein